MISRDCQIIDLDPYAWRSFGELLFPDPAPERVLSILHDGGRLLRAYDSERGYRDDIPPIITDPPRLALKLSQADPNLTRVQVFDKSALQVFAAEVNCIPLEDITAIGWRTQVAQMWRGTAGVYIEPSPPPNDYDSLCAFLAGIPDGNTVVIAVFDDNRLYAHVVLGVREGLIRLVTTFDALVPHGLNIDEVKIECRSTVLKMVSEHLGQVAFALFIARETFAKLLIAPNRLVALQEMSRRKEVIVDSAQMKRIYD